MQGCRFAAREIENCVISVLIDALMTPARLLEALAIADISGDQIRKLLGRATRLAATLRGAPGERAKLIRALVQQVIVDENRITIKVRHSALLAGNVPADASEASNGSTIEFTAAVDFKRHGAASKIVVQGLAQQTATRRAHRDAFDRTRSAIRLGRTAQTARDLNPIFRVDIAGILGQARLGVLAIV
jgi:hypothetical protein